jgi:thiol-disulfide isomerase/thioredoxin
MLAGFKRLLLAIPLLLCFSVAQAGVGTGDTPPDFVGKTRTDDAVHISDMYGKIVVIAFWASWCEYCRKELPVLAGIQKLVSPQKLQIVAINRDDRDTFLKLSHELRKATPGVIYTYDEGQIAKTYGVQVIPQTLLVDRDGKVAYKHVGYGDRTLDDLVDEINSLLAKPAQAAATPSS